MTRRNGAVIKTIIVVAVLLCGVYFIYIYNNVSGKLKETERVAERYRREQESLRSQLQDLSASKEDLQQRFENEKKEFVNRLNTLNQHHKMLKSQHDDLEADYTRLQSDRDKEKEDTRLQEAQRNQEYMQLKQEKDLEISSLRDQVANVARDKNECEQQVQTLGEQLKESQTQLDLEKSTRLKLESQVEDLKEQLKQQKIQLLQAQQAQQFRQHKVQDTDVESRNKNSDLHQNINQNKAFQQQQIQDQDQIEKQNPPQGSNVKFFENRLKNIGKKSNLGAGGLKVNRFGLEPKVDADLQERIDNKAIEHQQQQHQVQPPNLNQVEHQKDEVAIGQQPKLLPPTDGKQEETNVQQKNMADIIDTHQQQHQVLPPNQEEKADNNYLQDVNNENAGKEQNGGILDAQQQQHQVAPPGNHNDQEKFNQLDSHKVEEKKPDSNHAGEEDTFARNEGVAHQMAPPGGNMRKDSMVVPGGQGGQQQNLPNPNEVESVMKVGNEEHQQNLPLPGDQQGGKGGEHLSDEEQGQKQPALPNM